MRAKTMILVSTVALLFVRVPLFVGNVYADSAWHTCRIVQAGGAWGDGYVRLADMSATPAFAEKWFSFREGDKEQMSAIVNSAMNNQCPVRVRADIDMCVYPRIDAIQLHLEAKAKLHTGEPVKDT